MPGPRCPASAMIGWTSAAPASSCAGIGARTRFPEDFEPHPKLRPAARAPPRREWRRGSKPIDWAFAGSWPSARLSWEAPACACPARGRRSRDLRPASRDPCTTPERRPSSRRCASLTENQARFDVWNSAERSTAYWRFDYGYSFETPRPDDHRRRNSNDFANGAQTKYRRVRVLGRASGASVPRSSCCSPRLRGSGTRPLERTHPGATCSWPRRTACGSSSLDAGELLPMLRAGLQAPAQTAHRIHAQAAAALSAARPRTSASSPRVPSSPSSAMAPSPIRRR